MVLLVKLMRNFLYLKHRNKIGLLIPVFKINRFYRNIHFNVRLNVKSFMEHENRYAYNIMSEKGYTIGLNSDSKNTQITKEEFDLLLTRNWIQVSATEIFQIFPKFGIYCMDNNLCISNKIFDSYIDSLTDNIKHASDQELMSLFYSLRRWPETESIKTRNYIEVWAALDDECLNRIRSWSFDTILQYVALFYMLNVTRYSDFSNKSLQKLASKAKQLTPAQVVQTMFFISVFRKSPYDMHNLEVCIENHMSKFTIDELSIISMGFFKSKTPIRNMMLVEKIIEKVIENSKEIHEVSLAALLKVIRYSMKIKVDDKIYKLLDTLQHEVPRLSVMCNVHIALVGTATLTFHPECLNKVAAMITNSISQCRMKDLERLILSYGIFNYVPRTKECLFSKVINELQKSDREQEITGFGRSFACCVSYLGLLGLYPPKLINRVLDREFLQKTYGKQCHAYGREVLAVSNMAKIFCKESNLNLLSDRETIILSKKYTDFMPSEEFKKQYNVTEKFFLDIFKVLRESRGGAEYVIGYHILTHHQRGDIILCNDHSGQPLPVAEIFKSKKFGLLHPPPDDNVWIVLVIAGRNAMICKSDTPTGHFQSKVSELKALGYHAAMVSWNMYTQCKTNEEKEEYLNKLIASAIKK